MRVTELIFFTVLLLSVAVVPVVAGCQSIPFLQNAQGKIVDGVKSYCKEPQASRQALRQSVNTGLQGSASICVQCAGDAPDPTCAPPK